LLKVSRTVACKLLKGIREFISYYVIGAMLKTNEAGEYLYQILEKYR